uniref:Uncharacterized protein n=1 Tax=Tanacetum cinerariifolium TaxID=118510 RepID=A0A6L2KIT3_TANCI|nr:hypothetical protein [Tanacetum cinerariifolium]
MSTIFKPKEPTFQVALDVLSLTPLYPAFLITASVHAVYMHEFWASTSFHKHSIIFKLNTKSHSFDLDTFRNMFQICPKLLGQKFVDPQFEKEILIFIRELGYSGNIKLLSDVKVDILPQPWRTFRTIINKCLSGKNKYMLYLRFTKVIINHFMSQDQSILRRNKVDWNMANDDPILTTMRFIPQHEVVQKYGAILPDYLTTQAMKESEAYKTYYAFATGKAIPKPKYIRRSTKEKTEQAPKASSGKRIKYVAKVTRSGKKKQIAEGLETLSEIALSEAEQMKLAIERSKTQLHSSQPSGSGAHEGTGVTPGVPDVLTYDLIMIKYLGSLVMTKMKMMKQAFPLMMKKIIEEDNKEDSFDPRVQTPSHVGSTDDQDGDEEIHGVNVEGDKLDEEETNEEDEGDELYRDVNVNLEGRDIEITDAH